MSVKHGPQSCQVLLLFRQTPSCLGLMGVLFFWPLDPLFCHLQKHLLLDSNYIENHLSYCNELGIRGSWLPFKGTQVKIIIILNIQLNQKTHEGVTKASNEKLKMGNIYTHCR